MVSSVGERAEPLAEFALNENAGPVGDPIANVEIHVMNLDVS